MRARTTISFPFLGGPISGVLVGLCLPPFHHRVLPWFALCPLFLSLYRGRSRPWLRLVQALSFAGMVVLFTLPQTMGLGGTVTLKAPVESLPLGLAVPGPIAWAVPFLVVSTIALASGPLLRVRAVPLVLLGMPTLWTGLEVLGSELERLLSTGASALPALGYSILPEWPEAQVASAVGVFGLSWALTATSTVFLLVATESRGSRQALFALAGSCVPLACGACGRHLARASGGECKRSFSVVIVCQGEESLSGLIALSSRLGLKRADLVVWPLIPVVTLREGQGAPIVEGELRKFLEQTGATLVAGLRWDGALGPAARDVAVLDPRGAMIGWSGSAGARNSLGPSRVHPARSSRGIEPSMGMLGIGEGTRFASPAEARATVREGASLLVVCSSGPAAAGGTTQARLARMERFRAVENRRWLVRSGSADALCVDPFGTVTLQVLGGLEGAGVADVELSTSRSLYTLLGWYLEPACALVAVGILVAAAASARRLSASSPADPPDGPPGNLLS